MGRKETVERDLELAKHELSGLLSNNEIDNEQLAKLTAQISEYTTYLNSLKTDSVENTTSSGSEVEQLGKNTGQLANQVIYPSSIDPNNHQNNTTVRVNEVNTPNNTNTVKHKKLTEEFIGKTLVPLVAALLIFGGLAILAYSLFPMFGPIIKFAILLTLSTALLGVGKLLMNKYSDSKLGLYIIATGIGAYYISFVAGYIVYNIYNGLALYLLLLTWTAIAMHLSKYGHIIFISIQQLGTTVAVFVGVREIAESMSEDVSGEVIYYIDSSTIIPLVILTIYVVVNALISKMIILKGTTEATIGLPENKEKNIVTWITTIFTSLNIVMLYLMSFNMLDAARITDGKSDIFLIALSTAVTIIYVSIIYNVMTATTKLNKLVVYIITCLIALPEIHELWKFSDVTSNRFYIMGLPELVILTFTVILLIKELRNYTDTIKQRLYTVGLILSMPFIMSNIHLAWIISNDSSIDGFQADYLASTKIDATLESITGIFIILALLVKIDYAKYKNLISILVYPIAIIEFLKTTIIEILFSLGGSELSSGLYSIKYIVNIIALLYAVNKLMEKSAEYTETPIKSKDIKVEHLTHFILPVVSMILIPIYLTGIMSTIDRIFDYIDRNNVITDSILSDRISVILNTSYEFKYGIGILLVVLLQIKLLNNKVVNNNYRAIVNVMATLFISVAGIGVISRHSDDIRNRLELLYGRINEWEIINDKIVVGISVAVIIFTICALLANCMILNDLNTASKKQQVWLAVKWTLFTLAVVSVSDKYFVFILAMIILAFISISIGFKKNSKTLRYYGLGLIFFVIIKVVIFDMTFDGTVYAAIAYIISGIICFVIAFIYNHLDGKLKQDNQKDSTEANLEDIKHDEQGQ